MSSKLRLPAITPTLFNPEEWTLVQGTISRLSEPQLFWLSGYLAAGQQLPASAASPVPASAPQQAPVLIAYGGETGNSKNIAGQLQKLAEKSGVPVRVVDLAKVKLRQLGKENTLIVICSTHGDGDPPETITQFHDDLAHAAPGTLKHLKYAVLALGDSSYEKFCQTGKDIDQFLQATGAARLQDREDCDVDFARPAERWMQAVLERLASLGLAPAQEQPGPVLAAVETTSQAYTKNTPCTATVLESICLSHASRQEKMWHLELEADAAMDLQPGDAVGVLPRNSDALVDLVISAAGLDREATVMSNGATKSLAAALQHDCDLVLASKGLLESWQAWSGSEQLRALVAGDAAALRQYLKTVQLKDLLRQFPVRPDAAEFVARLRPLQPRLYDVANYRDGDNSEVHLLLKQYQYWFADRIETGIASEYLAGIRAGEELRIYPHHNARFHLAGDSQAPLILLAEGTGIAPYRAFLEKLRADQARRPCWLLFFEMKYEEDFLYQLEWQQAVADGLVTHFDGVFVNDEPGQSLQQRVIGEGARFMDWMGRDADVYLCGDRKILGDCEAALADYHDAQLTRRSGPEDGPALWKNLAKQGRIHRNLY